MRQAQRFHRNEVEGDSTGGIGKNTNDAGTSSGGDHLPAQSFGRLGDESYRRTDFHVRLWDGSGVTWLALEPDPYPLDPVVNMREVIRGRRTGYEAHVNPTGNRTGDSNKQNEGDGGSDRDDDRTIIR